MRVSLILVYALILLIGGAVVSIPSHAFADPPETGNPSVNPPATGNPGTTLINPLQGGTLESFLVNILQFVVRIGAIIVVLMYVYVGFKFVTAQGNDSKISEAKGMLLWTTIGALVLLGARVIAEGIKATVQGLTGAGG